MTSSSVDSSLVGNDDYGGLFGSIAPGSGKAATVTSSASALFGDDDDLFGSQASASRKNARNVTSSLFDDDSGDLFVSHGTSSQHHITASSHAITSHHTSSQVITSHHNSFTRHHNSSHVITSHQKSSHVITRHHIRSHVIVM